MTTREALDEDSNLVLEASDVAATRQLYEQPLFVLIISRDRIDMTRSALFVSELHITSTTLDDMH